MGWFSWVDQVSPPSMETFAPPSFAWMWMFGWSGLIQRSWLSPWGVNFRSQVTPPSVDFQ